MPLDVTVTSYKVQWYSFWYQWIKEVHTYRPVANIGVSGVMYRESRESVATNSFGRRVTKKKKKKKKNTSGGRGLNFQSTTIYLGVKLDRTPSYGQHLAGLSDKVMACSVPIHKLVGTG